MRAFDLLDVETDPVSAKRDEEIKYSVGMVQRLRSQNTDRAV